MESNELSFNEQLKQALNSGVVRVEFTKKNSTETRTMICTRLPELMPLAKGTGKTAKPKGLCVVGRIAQYDNEERELRPVEFRSFYENNVNWFEVLHDCTL